MKRGLAIAVVLGLATLPMCPGSVHAQTAASQPTTSKAAPVREVYPRDLMTMRERFDMWRKMRAARTPEERFELWAQNREMLEKRAIEKGVVLREMGPMMKNNGGGREGQRRSGAENGRERMMGMHGGGMRPQPPHGM